MPTLTIGDCNGMYLDNCNSTQSCECGPSGPSGSGATGPTGSGATGPTGVGATGPTGMRGPTGSGVTGTAVEFGTAQLSIGNGGPSFDDTSDYEHLYFNSDHGFSIIGVTGPTGTNAGIVNNLAYPLLTRQPPPVTGPTGTSGNDIELTWDRNTPHTIKSAFSVAPSGLIVNAQGTRTQFDRLPFIKGFYLEYKTPTSTWSKLCYDTQVSGWESSVISSSRQPTHLHKFVIKATSPSSSISAPSISPRTGINGIEVDIDIGNNVSNITDSYRFRFAFYNYADEGANKDKINWVYFQGSYTFGGFGPATAPASISLSSSRYDELLSSGLGGAHLDASKNTPYSSNAPISAKYGFDLSGSRIAFLQVGGQTVDISHSFETNSLKTQAWDLSISNYAHPEYKFETIVDPSQSYYAINDSTDFSSQKVYALGDASSNVIVPIPTRTQANAPSNGNNYETPITGNDASNGVLNLTFSGGTPANTPYERTGPTAPNYIQHPGVYFIKQGDKLTITGTVPNKNPSLNLGTAIQNPNSSTDLVSNDSKLGIDASGSRIGLFGADISSSVGSSNLTQPLTSNDISGSWIPNSPGTVKNQNFHFEVKDIVDIAASSNSREGGYYLGCTVSDLIVDVSLASLKDICNNNFDPYTINFTQTMYANNGEPDKIYNLASNFKLAEDLSQNTTLSNYDTSGDQVTSSTAYFYGLPLTSQASFKVKYNISDINPEWAPSNTDKIYHNILYLGTGISSKHKVDDNSLEWRETNRDTTINIDDTLNASFSDGDFSQLPYSRDSGNPNTFLFSQFIMESKIENNINMSNATLTTETSDVSFNNKYAWWDYTWNTGQNVPNVNNPKNISIINNVGTSSSTISASLTEMPQPIPFEETATSFTPTFSEPPVPASPLNFQSDISFNTAMWAKNAYWSSSGSSYPSTRTTNPYIDYTSFEEGAVLKNYQSYDASGNTKTWSIGSNYVGGTLGSTQTYSVTNSKWLCLRVDLGNVPSWQVCKVDVKDASDNVATIGQDYFLFVKEEIQVSTDKTILWLNSSDPNNTSSTLNNGNFVLTTPWLDAMVDKQPSTNSYKPFVESQNPTGGSTSDKSAYNGIALSNASATWSSTAPSIGHAHAGKKINQYLAFCIPNDQGIREVKLTYIG